MADANRHSIYAVKETSYGVTPNNPELVTIRNIGVTVGLSKDSLQSDETRSDRQITDFRQGAEQIGGDINIELSYGSFDMFIEAGLLSTDWASPASISGILNATATGFTQSLGSFIDEGFAEGQIVKSSGFVASGFSGQSVVTSVEETVLTTDPISGTHGVEAGNGNELIIASERVSSGTTRRSFTLVRHFADIEASDKPYYIYRGCEINSMTLTIGANAKVTGTFTFIGQSQETVENLSALGTPTFPQVSQTSILNSFTGKLKESGVTIGVITEITLTLENGLEAKFVIGDKNTIQPSVGQSNLTGQITAFFENSTLVEKFLNETESSINFTLPDDSGNLQSFTIPRIKYTGGQPDTSGQGPIIITLPFQALYDSDKSSNFIIERIAG